MSRINDLRRFYSILGMLEQKLGGKRVLASCTGRMTWPQRGVYFFYELGETRSHSGEGPRVVRVGTHALTSGSKSTLWGRLKQHQGSLSSRGGNHRGSIFRLHIGTALIRRDGWIEAGADRWGSGSSASREVRQAEVPLERAVCDHICQMPFLWLAVEDEPNPASQRGIIEHNSIALLSNYNSEHTPVDPPSPTWLGHWADREAVRCSGLWNVNHVTETYDPAFLNLLEKLVKTMQS